MLKNHDRFYSANGKRLVLVVDDEAINREMLGMILAEKFDILYAENGREALETIRAHSSQLALVLLDLMMPEMDGFQLMDVLREDPELHRLPVIVLTSEKAAEVRSLRMGAADFISKPYELPEVIQARVQRSIELAEETYIIQETERDSLTGLLNQAFFYRYADQFDVHHQDQNMDAVVIDINHFHLINELYGWTYGDSILAKIGEYVLQLVTEAGGIAGRKDADIFMLYCPTGTDYEALIGKLIHGLPEEISGTRVRMRVGVYENVDRSIEIERRFDRAKLASNAKKGSFLQVICRYDESLHKDEFLHEQLVNDMEQALAERQFEVYYQPKYDITGEAPVLKSAEALIRWRHPKLGMVNPGIFVPLFEHNGLITRLDRFVWKEAAAQIRKWREKYGVTIPLSVNVSRIDMYAVDFIPFLQNLVSEQGIAPEDFWLEVTESAYTEDQEQIVAIASKLRELRFPVEMDDFGSGYSSLNMLATLPIDALKLDMSFIRNMKRGEKNIRMLELMVDIARYLDVVVIAEGVETEDQMRTLQKMGCQVIQGYYFSRPVPAGEFERFIKEKVEKTC